ncbi:MAG: hypothetical protein H6765_03830 [Candidatus Peribacteria bacterium]|nr:MAG: hypothetical protein H6765_03830 [Candidatus Peribacteria bacterium]
MYAVEYHLLPYEQVVDTLQVEDIYGNRVESALDVSMKEIPQRFKDVSVK